MRKCFLYWYLHNCLNLPSIYKVGAGKLLALPITAELPTMSVNCRSSSRHPGTISCYIAAALTWPVFKIDWPLNSVVDSIGIACCHEARSLSPVGCPHRSLKSFVMQTISSKSLDEASRRASNALSRAAFERPQNRAWRQSSWQSSGGPCWPGFKQVSLTKNLANHNQDHVECR